MEHGGAGPPQADAHIDMRAVAVAVAAADGGGGTVLPPLSCLLAGRVVARVGDGCRLAIVGQSLLFLLNEWWHLLSSLILVHT